MAVKSGESTVDMVIIPTLKFHIYSLVLQDTRQYLLLSYKPADYGPMKAEGDTRGIGMGFLSHMEKLLSWFVLQILPQW